MTAITYIERTTQEKKIEKVYGARCLQFLYGSGWSSQKIGRKIARFTAKNAWVSALYGWWQHQRWTASKIAPFIEKFDVDATEFSLSVEQFRSFNDFFTRELKKEARPIAPGTDCAIIPADGRYLFHQNIALCDGFVVKGQKFQLAALLQDEKLAAEYACGSMVMARLAPSDYHRFHFPCDCYPTEAKALNGLLHSVNPIAVKQNIAVFSENKRTLTRLASEAFGTLLFIEVGATNVGTIMQTYKPGAFCSKGSEKGYFSFGGSSLLLLFPPGVIQFDADLLAATQAGFEIKCLMGQSMGSRAP